MVNVFKKVISPPLVLAYAAVEGVFLGIISHIYGSMWDGIVLQAVLATARHVRRDAGALPQRAAPGHADVPQGDHRRASSAMSRSCS